MKKIFTCIRRAGATLPLLILLCASLALAGTVTQFPYGISADDIYDYDSSTGWLGTYKMSLPTLTANDTILGTTTTQTLTNKTLTTPVIASFYQDAGKTKLMTTPNTASDTLCAIAAEQALTNKTLTTPIIPSFYQDAGKTKLMTTPNTASDTLCAIAATQALTNKTLTAPVITSPNLTFAVADVTTDYTVLSTDAGKILTNSGAGAAITFTLPEASTVIGKPFHFVVVTADTVNVDVDAADIIVPLTNAAGDKIVNTGTLGNMVTLVAVDNTNFVTLGKEVGTWSDGN